MKVNINPERAGILVNGIVSLTFIVAATSYCIGASHGQKQEREFQNAITAMTEDQKSDSSSVTSSPEEPKL